MAETNNANQTAPSWLEQRPVLFELFFPALVTVLGFQSLRVLVPGLTWVLGDRFSLGAPILGLVALAIFATTFLAGNICRLIGTGGCVRLSVFALCASRLLLQTWWQEPVINLALAAISTISFVIFIPAYFERSRSEPGARGFYLALGLLLGLSIDTGLHGVYETYDMAWQNDAWSLIITASVIAAIMLLMLKGRRFINTNQACLPLSWGAGLPLLAIGPFIFLQLQIFQNIARLTTLTGWQLPLAFGWIMLANVLGLTLATRIVSNTGNHRGLLALLLSLVLLVSCLLPETAGIMSALYLITGQAAICAIITLIIINSSQQGIATGQKPYRASVVALGAGMLIMVILILVFYATYQINLPFNTAILEPLSAFVIVACLVPVCQPCKWRLPFDQRAWLATATSIILLSLSFASMAFWQKPANNQDTGQHVKIMSYNLHNGFNTRGHLDLEALAKNIETHQPDIIALQEISRGWLVNGRVDMLSWLGQRLGMPYIFGATAGPLWGNAIISRFEILQADRYALPPQGLPIERGWLEATIDLGENNSISIIATHFHHVEEDSTIRQQQAEVLLDHWNNRSGSIILGDLNAIPGSAEMNQFEKAGLIDVIGLTEPPPAYTFHADSPYERIDYIWTSSDITIHEVTVIPSIASDHLAIMATIDTGFKN